MGTDGEGKNVPVRDTFFVKLEAIGLAEVKIMLPWMTGNKPKKRLRKPPGQESFTDILSDLVAVSVDGRPQGGEDIQGGGTSPRLHPPNGFPEHAPKGPPPAAMDRSDGALLLIDKENGQAIGGLDNQEETGQGGDEGVAAEPPPRNPVHKMDDIRMNLLQVKNPEILPAPVFPEILLRPGSSPETVDKEGNPIKAGNGEKLGPPFHGSHYATTAGLKTSLESPSVLFLERAPGIMGSYSHEPGWSAG